MVENTPNAWDARAELAPSEHAASLCSARGQTARFLAVLRHLELSDGDVVLDFGCGTARLASFLPLERGVEYVGVDSSPGMRERARQEHPELVVIDELELAPDDLFEWIVVVGTFNLADRWSISQTYEKLEELFVERATRGLVACLYRGSARGMLRYDLEGVARFVAELGSPRYAIDASYLGNDVLVAVYR